MAVQQGTSGSEPIGTILPNLMAESEIEKLKYREVMIPNSVVSFVASDRLTRDEVYDRGPATGSRSHGSS